jgi:KUP system potassium uptake protein
MTEAKASHPAPTAVDSPSSVSAAGKPRSDLAKLALGALGVVYGDIGTSPLYALKECVTMPHGVAPMADNIFGLLSLLFWSITLVVSGKYILYIMRADNNGEGGIVALMARVLAQPNLTRRRRRAVLMLGLAGAALFYGDGAITPAISVLSAVEGLEVATPAFKPYVIPITLGILAALFAIQKHGTARVGLSFGPIMFAWFALLAVLGVVHIAANPAVLSALWPGYGIAFLAAHPRIGYLALGAVFLALTGAEALYADMGHFGRRPIRAAWFWLVFPALVLNYFGQGALLLKDAATIRNPFYLLAPDWGLYPMVAIATAATVIASQAVITGVYSITHQAIQLGYAPRMAVRHTSGRAMGQIYVPAMNLALFAVVAALVVAFQSSSNLAAAYGIAVSGTMIITTMFAFLVARNEWRWPAPAAAMAFGALLAVDVTFFSANSVKIADGGWFPLVFGAGVLALLTTWKRGRELVDEQLDKGALPLAPFIESVEREDLPTAPLTAIFLTSTPDFIPHPLLHNLKHNGVLHERVVICHVTVLPTPRVPPTQHVVVERLSKRFFRVSIYYGFMEDQDVPASLEWCGEQGLALDPMATSYFLGRETVLPRVRRGMSGWRQRLFAAMFRNAGTSADHFKLPPNRVVELGTQVTL